MTEDARRTGIYFDLKQNNFDYESYNKKSLEFLKDRLTDKGKTGAYVFNKMRFFLGERDHQYTFALTAEKSAMPFVNSLAVLGQMQYLVLVVLAAWSVLLQIRGNDNRWIFMLIALAGFISVYAFIEAQTRYRYEAYLIIIMLASHELGSLYSKYGSATK